MNAAAGTQAGHVRVLITNEGAHTAQTWANETARAIIDIDPAMPLARRVEALRLRTFLGSALLSIFNEVRADSSMAELQRIARQVREALVDEARGSPWQVNFEGLADVIELTIWRNLHTAADIAVKME